jgi:hypothetical protein
MDSNGKISNRDKEFLENLFQDLGEDGTCHRIKSGSKDYQILERLTRKSPIIFNNGFDIKVVREQTKIEAKRNGKIIGSVSYGSPVIPVALKAVSLGKSKTPVVDVIYFHRQDAEFAYCREDEIRKKKKQSPVS